jgi:predicted ArsR family transcriptional regulator
MQRPFSTRQSESSRGRIVELLRAGGMTVDEIAAQLGLSHNAIRVQLTSMERDGLVHHTRSERRTTRPAHIFELTHDTRQWLSKAYVPFLTHLTGTIAKRQTSKEVGALMREVGRSLADALRARAVTSGPLAARAAAASITLNEELGAVTRVEPSNGHFVIRGHGCPLAAVTADHPVACLAIETFIAKMTDSQVHECCTRQDPPQCCFEISSKPLANKPTANKPAGNKPASKAHRSR